MPPGQIALAVAAALTLQGSVADAAPSTTVILEYEVLPNARGCQDAEEFKATVSRQLGHDPFRDTADRRVHVQISRKESGFDGEVNWTDATGASVGDRRLSSRRTDCHDIGASLAFLVVVQIQLLDTLARTPPPPTAPPSPPPIASPPAPLQPAPLPQPVAREATPSQPPPDPPKPRSLSLSAGLGPALSFSALPTYAGIARIFVSGRLTRFSVELALDGSLPSDKRHIDGSGFSIFRVAVGAAACGHASIFAACVMGTTGILQAHGVGVDRILSPRGWFAQIGARLAIRHEFGSRYFAAARVDGLVMPFPWTVTVNDAPSWTTPRAATILGLDVGIRFF